jgi:organic hydroperoxide reductase OsmC/OhrA
MQVETRVAHARGMTEHTYTTSLRWIGNLGNGTATYAGYDREHRIAFAGKPALLGSADPAFRGARDRYNPEELLVAALSACHMLSYLALCARAGIRVETYEDAARGRMIQSGGGGRFAEVVLAPRVGIAPESDLALARALHEQAHAGCFIASSCNFPVTHAAEVAHVAHVGRAHDTRRDVAIRLPHRPGALAELGEVLGRAGCSIEGGGGFEIEGGCVVHFLFDDGARAAEAARSAGFDVLSVQDVIVERLDQDRPGQLGSIARAMADAGVNITAVYSDHDHRLILGVDDLAAARRAAATWASKSA